MPKSKRKSSEKWEHSNYKRCYAYNRNGLVYFSINTKRIACSPSIAFEPKNKQLALQYLHLYAEKYLAGIIEEPKTLFDLFEVYHNSQFQTLKKDSQKTLKYTYNKYLKKDYKLNELLQFKTDLIKIIETSNLTNNSKNATLSRFSTILNYGIKIGWIKENVLINLKYRKDLKKDLDFTFEDYNLLIQSFQKKSKNNDQYLRILKFLRYSGCRINEAITLTTNSLLKDKIEIHGKGDRIRYIYNQYIDEYDFIFPNKKVAWNFTLTIKSNINSYCKIRNLKWNGFHALRKLRENELIDKYNLPDTVVAEMIGHTIEVQAKVYRQMRTDKDKIKFAELYKTLNAE